MQPTNTELTLGEASTLEYFEKSLLINKILFQKTKGIDSKGKKKKKIENCHKLKIRTNEHEVRIN